MPPEASGALPGFQAVAFDLDQCRRDLDAFDALLASSPELGEQQDLLPFFRTHPQLSLFLGSYDTNLDSYDRIAYEFDLFGQFTADLVVGDWDAKSYCFVEFEEARTNSIFQTTSRHTTVWAPRFERGFSQIVDWFWLLEAHQDSQAFERTFGKRRIAASGLLVVGRDTGVAPGDRLRLEWRRDRVSIGGQKVFCCTFDELARRLRRKLEVRPTIPLD